MENKNLENLELENESLKYEIETLKEMIKKVEEEKNKSWGEVIDENVEKWYEKFKDDVDIGRITTFEMFGKKMEIDVLPDVMEKAIYKKCLKIMMAIFLEFKGKI